MKKCKVIKGGEGCQGKQGLDYFSGVPHLPYNPTDKVAKAILARTDPNEQESVVLI